VADREPPLGVEPTAQLVERLGHAGRPRLLRQHVVEHPVDPREVTLVIRYVRQRGSLLKAFPTNQLCV